MTTVNVRYMVDDVDAAIAFYTTHLGFSLLTRMAPAFADVARGDLRLLLSGANQLGGAAHARRPPARAGGWNRIQLIVDDIAAEVGRLRGRVRSGTRSSGARGRPDPDRGPVRQPHRALPAAAR